MLWEHIKDHREDHDDDDDDDGEFYTDCSGIHHESKSSLLFIHMVVTAVVWLPRDFCCDMWSSSSSSWWDEQISSSSHEKREATKTLLLDDHQNHHFWLGQLKFTLHPFISSSRVLGRSHNIILYIMLSRRSHSIILQNILSLLPDAWMIQ